MNKRDRPFLRPEEKTRGQELSEPLSGSSLFPASPSWAPLTCRSSPRLLGPRACDRMWRVLRPPAGKNRAGASGQRCAGWAGGGLGSLRSPSPPGLLRPRPPAAPVCPAGPGTNPRTQPCLPAERVTRSRCRGLTSPVCPRAFGA